MPLTLKQQAYLQGLRDGDIIQSLLDIQPQLSDKAQIDFNNFDQFLRHHGHPNPEPADLFLTVLRKSLLRILHYADDRDRRCLILQNCFALDHPVNEGGRVVLLQKGNFTQFEGQSDDDLFFGDTVYRNNEGKLEVFINFNLDQQLPIVQAQEFIANFLALYPGRSIDLNPFIHGYLLPVKALINVLNDPNHPLGSANELTVRWGLTRFNTDGTLGNFTLAIGTGDLNTGPVIEFRTEAIVGTGGGDCPPARGCA